MHPDDVKAALDALASEVPGPNRGAGEATARGRRRIKHKRIALAGVAAVLIAAVAIVGTVSGSNHDAHQVTSVPTTSAPFVPHAGASSPAPSSMFPSTLEAWKCGNPLQFTDDGGRTWRQVALPAEVPSGGGECTALPGGTAWMAWSDALGHGRVMQVRDFAETRVFSLPPIRVDQTFQQLTFVDENHGWVIIGPAGGAADLYRTIDGGATWKLATHRALGQISFADADHGWSDYGPTLFATTDGGTSWRPVALPSPPVPGGRYISHFEVLARGASVIVWSGVQITGSQFRTFFDVSNDRGRTWNLRSGPAGFERPAAVENAFDATDGTHWALTSEHALRTTADGGLTWQVRPDLPLDKRRELMPPIRFPTPEVGWLMAPRGLLRTTDGGSTWSNVLPYEAILPVPRPAPPAPPVNIPIAVASANDAWLCGEPLQHTSDGGVSWKYRDVPSHAAVRPGDQYPLCAATPGGNLWLLTESQQAGQPEVIRFEPGHDPRVFAFPDLPSSKTIVDFTFVDAQHGWALSDTINGTGGDLYATTDGGATWSDIDRDTSVSGPIRFTSSTDGWASSKQSETSILHTTDGGHTWQPVRVPTPKALPGLPSGAGLGAITPDAIVAIGSAPSGNLTRLFFDVSTDGGHTWTTRSGPTNRTFGTTEPRAFSAIDANHWQLSGLNSLWTTADGGRAWKEVAEFAGLSRISSVGFLSPDIGFVSGVGSGQEYSATVALQTNDGGSSWTTVAEHAPPLPANATVVNFPGGIVGCPTRPLTPPPSGNPPAGLVDAAKAFMRPEPQTVGQVYRVGQNPKGSFGSLFKFQVGSCGDETVANAWVVELYGPIGQGGGGSTDQTQLALAHSADGWHVFGRYH